MENIKKGWGEFSIYSRFKVGDGYKVRFWHDLCVWGLGPQGSISRFVLYCSC